MTLSTAEEIDTEASGISSNTISRARFSWASFRKENRKPTQTDLIPRLRNRAQAARTSASSIATETSPVGGRIRSEIAIRLRRLTSGFDCHGTSKCSEKLNPL